MSVFSPNTEKYGPKKKLRIWALFKQWKLWKRRSVKSDSLAMLVWEVCSLYVVSSLTSLDIEEILKLDMVL